MPLSRYDFLHFFLRTQYEVKHAIDCIATYIHTPFEMKNKERLSTKSLCAHHSTSPF